MSIPKIKTHKKATMKRETGLFRNNTTVLLRENDSNIYILIDLDIYILLFVHLISFGLPLLPLHVNPGSYLFYVALHKQVYGCMDVHLTSDIIFESPQTLYASNSPKFSVIFPISTIFLLSPY